MDPKAKFFKFIILFIGLLVIAFNAQLYNVFEQQKNEINTMNDLQKTDEQVNSNKFKYQQDQIERLGKDLEDAQQQIKDQKDALLQEAEKRQQVESQSKSIQTSLVDIKAEADAIKQDMKGWQKDYVTVLAELEKKMDSSQDELKHFEDNLNSLNIPELKENINSLKAEIEQMTHPPDNGLPVASSSSAPEKKIDRTEIQSSN